MMAQPWAQQPPPTAAATAATAPSQYYVRATASAAASVAQQNQTSKLLRIIVSHTKPLLRAAQFATRCVGFSTLLRLNAHTTCCFEDRPVIATFLEFMKLVSRPRTYTTALQLHFDMFRDAEIQDERECRANSATQQKRADRILQEANHQQLKRLASRSRLQYRYMWQATGTYVERAVSPLADHLRPPPEHSHRIANHKDADNDQRGARKHARAGGGCRGGHGREPQEGASDSCGAAA